MIYIFIALIILIGFIRAVSFGVWHFREKNVSGGIALLMLAVLSFVSSLINLLS